MRLSKTSVLHYFKLVFRSLLFIAALVIYIVNRVGNSVDPFGEYGKRPLILSVIWVVFFVEMVLRFFPSDIESMGCRKQFKRNYKPTGREYKNPSWRPTFFIVLSWLGLNGIIAVLFYTGIVDEGILILTALFYSVCDMICILFFCPFQTWFMKNKCCGSCRIYNWDYAMMCTPLIMVDNHFARSLVFVSLILLAVWEIAFKLHPERFSTSTNECLSCANCKEKLCHHKKQLRHFLVKNKNLLEEKGNAILDKVRKK